MSEVAGTPRSRTVLRILLFLTALAVFLLVARWIKQTGLLDQALAWIQSLGPWAPIVFVLLYVITVVVCMPAAILTAGGGFIFGMLWGSIYVLAAATIAAIVNFLISRHVARDWVSRRLAANPRFQALDRAVAREGWKIVVLVRLAPVFPFSITSYAFGLSRIPLWEFFLANFAMIPGTLMYVYFGSLGRDLTQSEAKPLWMKLVFGALTFLAVFYVARFAKRALSQRIS